MASRIIYSIVVPVYNEELVVDESYRRLKEVMNVTKEVYEIIFVNDGSSDSTREKVNNICKTDENIRLINFSRNFGHQAAITAGMEVAMGDAIVVIDADLQDPPEVILKMIKQWKEGYEVVYAKRAKREGEGVFKKVTAGAFYRVLRSMTTIDIPVDTGDFRLIDRKVCEALKSLPEKNRYVRGLVSWVGYKQTAIEFIRHERFAGETKYPLKKMVKLAFDGITSFSHKPITIAAYVGGALFSTGIIGLMFKIISSLIEHKAVVSLGMLLTTNLIMFGLILLSIGMMGQYIGRIFDESKSRPMYIIESNINYRKVENKYEIGV